jgi:hypothetical protein
VRFTGDAILALSHDEADGVLAALGSPVCRCQILQSCWPVVQDDPEVLWHLLRDESEPAAWESPLPPLLRRVRPARTDRLTHRAELGAVVSAAPPELRLALARHVVEQVIADWSEPGARGSAYAVEHAVRAVLACEGIPAASSPPPWFHVAVTGPGTASRVGTIENGRLSVEVPVTWLLDVAAAGQVRQWWREAWAA